MNSIGDQFLIWLSGQSGRQTTMSKAKAVASTLGSRFSGDDFNAVRLLSNLHRGGHVERVMDGRTYMVATNPVLVVNDSNTDIVNAEWISARVRKTISGLASQFDLHVHSTATRENYSRTFLSGRREQIEQAASAVEGNVEFDPGRRLLRMCPPISRERLTGEQAAIPHSQPLETLAFTSRGKSWKRVKYSPDLRPGVYRINERPIRWLWHDAGVWNALDGPERLSAAWLHCHVHGSPSLVFDKARGLVEIKRIGFPLPVLIDRALRLAGGPPTWNRKHIVYLNLDAAIADQLARAMRFNRHVERTRDKITV